MIEVGVLFYAASLVVATAMGWFLRDRCCRRRSRLRQLARDRSSSSSTLERAEQPFHPDAWLLDLALGVRRRDGPPHFGRVPVNRIPLIRPTGPPLAAARFGPELVAGGAGVDCRLSRGPALLTRPLHAPGRGRGDAIR